MFGVFIDKAIDRYSELAIAENTDHDKVKVAIFKVETRDGKQFTYAVQHLTNV